MCNYDFPYFYSIVVVVRLSPRGQLEVYPWDLISIP